MSNTSEASKSDSEAKPGKTITIFVNTRPHAIDKKEDISFEEVVAIAYPTAPAGTNVAYSVMFERADGSHDGTLVPGQTVKVREGMRFDVTATDRS